MEVWLLAAVAGIAVVAVAAIRRRRRAQRAVPYDAGTPTGWRDGLRATRRRLSAALDDALLGARRPLDETLADVEEALIAADLGARTAGEMCRRIRERVGPDGAAAAIRSALREELATALASAPAPVPAARPWVILVTGVNGVGKTTTIGKLAGLYARTGRRVLLVAADTFRAAAADQLAAWAARTGADLVRHEAGGAPSAVVFDGLTAARARAADVVIIDTAGRLHTHDNLMDELRKIRRVAAREIPAAPHESYVVLDATTGQNAVNQARLFADAAGATGVILTKLDGTARGGVAVAVRSELGLPIRYVGVGEEITDLRPFDSSAFVAALLDDGTEGTRS